MSSRKLLIISWFTGYLLILIGMSIEDIMHGSSFILSLGDIHHHVFPVIAGSFTSALSHLIISKNKSLSDLKDLLNQVTEQSPSVYELYDIEGLQIGVNKAYEDLWQFPEGRQRTVGKFNVLKSKEVEKSGLLTSIKNAYAGNTITLPPYTFDPTGKTEANGAGRVRWLNTKIYPLITQDKVTNIVITHEDITDRMQAEESLARSEHKYRNFFNTVNNGWGYHKVVTDSQNRPIDYVFLEVNEAYENLTGLGRDDIIGQRVTEVFPGTVNDPANWIRRFGDVALTGVACSFENYSEDISKWFSVSATCPEPGYFIVVFNDITERKMLEESLGQSEFFFKESQRAASIGSYKSDFVNDTWVTSEVLDQIFGMDPNYNKCVKGWTELLHPDDMIEMTQYMMQDVIEKNIPFNKEYRIIRRTDGETRWVLGLGDTIVDDTGAVVGLIGTIQDVTDKKLAEQEKEALVSQLQQSHKMEAIGTMAGGIAHDFNNLLSIISGNIDVIQHKHNAGSYAEENIGHIKNAASRAKSLVAQILAFSRQEQLDLAPVDLSIVLNDALKLLRATIPSTVEIMTAIDKSPVVINADSTQLQQVFINLCTNAVYAMGEKGLLTISLRDADLATKNLPASVDLQTEPYVVISFCDTGSGMQKEMIDKIFDPFFTTKALGDGTGMGLSVVHGIVEQHGGFITVDSAAGQGTTFNIYFPTISTTEVEQKTDTEESLPTGTERILFVDDEECIADICSELLELQGYSVTSVTSSPDAFDLFNASPDDFDLILTDQTMPGLSGSELAAKLLAIRPDIPIILCSGYSAKLSEADAKGIGIREFCMKPMDMKQLATVVRKVLDESGKPK